MTHALVVAPTGSGKTLAASSGPSTGCALPPPAAEPQRRCRVLYVSPMKALAVDVERNLRAPLDRHPARRRPGSACPSPRSRVGAALRRHPCRGAALVRPHAAGRADHHAGVAVPPADLAGARRRCAASRRSSSTRSTRVAGTKRGAHLALSLERLDALLDAAGAADRPVRDGPARWRRSPGGSAARATCPSHRPAAGEQGVRPAGRRPGARPGGARCGCPGARAPGGLGPGGAEPDLLDLTGNAAGPAPAVHLAPRRGACGRPRRRAPLDARVRELAAAGRAAHRPA